MPDTLTPILLIKLLAKTALLCGLVAGGAYAFGRWRELRADPEHPDPQLGIKIALNALELYLLLVFVFGLSLLVTGIIAIAAESEGDHLWKEGLGMIVGAVISFVLLEVFYQLFTNHREHPAPRRMLAGVAVLILCVVAVSTFVLFWMGLFGGWTQLAFSLPTGMAVWFCIAAVMALRLYRNQYFPPPPRDPIPYTMPGGGYYPPGYPPPQGYVPAPGYPPPQGVPQQPQGVVGYSAPVTQGPQPGLSPQPTMAGYPGTYAPQPGIAPAGYGAPAPAPGQTEGPATMVSGPAPAAPMPGPGGPPEGGKP
jgi:hypothetical protein